MNYLEWVEEIRKEIRKGMQEAIENRPKCEPIRRMNKKQRRARNRQSW
jgi:hypothetical protein